VSLPLTLVLLERDTASAAATEESVRRARDVGVLVAADFDALAEILARARATALVVGGDPGGFDPLSVCRRLKGDPALRALPVWIGVEPGDRALKERALDAGADDFVTLPLEAAELVAKARSAGRAADAASRAAAAEAIAATAREELRVTREGVSAMLGTLLEAARPGSTDRGTKVAALALALADRFGIPQPFRPDLEFAARFHFLGRLAAAPPVVDGAPEPWRAAQLAQSILKHVAPLRDAPDVIGSMYENWDGTGHPDHLQQGQIPLRSRMLRVLSDFFDLLESDDALPSEEAHARLAAHAGTRYDPLVLVHLRAVLGETHDGDLRSSCRVVEIQDLRPGMVLADDLTTDSGVKLLARDTVLTPATLGMILRRHRLEPIVPGAVVRRGMG
jgi:response regulator RpfG family c-di-GMP phosphodiesterase